MMTLDVNTDAVVKYAQKLDKLHKSDLPLAVRATLNDAAFGTKKGILPSAQRKMTVRNRMFFNKFTGVNKADGWNVNKMQSEVGMHPQGNIAAKYTALHEVGGTVPKRDFIYHDQARTGGSESKQVRKANYLNSRKFVKGAQNRSRGRKSALVAAAIVARDTGKLLKHNTSKGDMLFDVRSVKFTGSGRSRNVKINMKPIADYEPGRTTRVKKQPFISPVAIQQSRRMDQYFIKNANYRIKKRMKA